MPNDFCPGRIGRPGRRPSSASPAPRSTATAQRKMAWSGNRKRRFAWPAPPAPPCRMPSARSRPWKHPRLALVRISSSPSPSGMQTSVTIRGKRSLSALAHRFRPRRPPFPPASRRVRSWPSTPCACRARHRPPIPIWLWSHWRIHRTGNPRENLVPWQARLCTRIVPRCCSMIR